MRLWSYGEISKPETINYRTQKPEKDGLFDERIFGPTKDWECYCGKYKKIRYKGIVCDKCGVEITTSLVRRERMGHIELKAPAAHIWFLRGVPSRIGLVLDLSLQNLEKVIYFAAYIIISVNEDLKNETLEKLRDEFKGKRKMLKADLDRELAKYNPDTDGGTLRVKEDEHNKKLAALSAEFSATENEIKELQPLTILSEHSYHEFSLKYGHFFDAGIGAEGIHYLLKNLDLKSAATDCEQELKDAPQGKRDKLIRRMKVLRSFLVNGIKPEWMILTVIPVIPPDLRPMVALDGGRFATSDLNDLYRRVINRNNRLKRLLELNAPDVIVRNEKRMLQEAVDALIDNSARHAKTVTASTGQRRQLRSLADILKGKQGRFRQNLLGKRTDYSGRSVIVVGPKLKLHQCGLPKRMALELFKPYIIAELIKRELVHNIRSATRFIESGRAEIWDILEEVTKNATVLLNRAPTLHRLGIQAFQPILIEGKAIQIHPLVCPAFNADFDGDQMAVHVPLTDEAKTEAREIMLSSKNLLKPAHGNPVAQPNKDIAWGCFYMTSPSPQEPQRIKYFGSPEEAVLAYEMRHLGLQEKIMARGIKTHEDELLETTVGRILFNRILFPKLPYYNQPMDVKRLGDMTRLAMEIYGVAKTAELLDEIKELGFKSISRSGFSWSMEDLPTLPKKQEFLNDGQSRVDEVEEQYASGLLTDSERHTKIIEIWTEIKDAIVKESKQGVDKAGSVYSMVESGARGSWGQLTQMVGMKGLVANPAGDIIELPVKASFKEGFKVLEYFISTHGSRKGLSDTALRTANAGYLTRRLVDVSQDVVIRQEDCGDTEGAMITKAESDEIGESFASRLIGRFTLEDVKIGRKTIVKRDEIMTDTIAKQIDAAGLQGVRMRSTLRCKTRKGLCVRCYGYDLGHNKPVVQGVAVGIIAAQSIGEPGTQLTMRTFHTGGVAGLDITQGLPRVEELFEVRTPKKKAFMTDVAGTASIETGERIIETPTGRKIVGQTGQKIIKITADDGAIKEYIIPPGYVLWVKGGDTVEVGAQLTEGALDPHELFLLRGKEAVEKYLLHEVQGIYSSQGQKLNDKHIEVIVRQLFSRVLIKDPGDTDLLPGETVEKAEFDEENDAVGKKGKLAEGEELLLGVTKVSLSTRSFLSAASFQETARVLINAAVTGKIDRLDGLKENVIIGRLIPAGTGFKASK
ncbi:DNA-directed RNA polymerase subunit beta' [Candidatus Uhrbacteria bacterium RIFCSPHIGHO2_12_FULL_47_11]|nr:MAG: DNA-directed RNA polymerase subunit beta' [Candidatus Uhrbacteria bacterium RIFCSPHIGHO2_01_FULL_47_11]OGL68206.1 MAG: DNA-directed RNA polymerase subunit beta' [Candidatus Uhrbacteria bacterium RIFCSPHIGHO2_02_FULL_46_47]OGL76047.1 MAG: DNA-directed RNA polymerase subunit beta' [Candidatus Uhrbacteria bacterium RIFCSPHIGHO2_12_FULL_47_11]OGL83849.1 MAG: DNA-directed RNA polymerase subunit beta' [Candidatus Uhrbacteria bacterium RIFCSPLOWO2_02_FULL_46_25]OGL92388.1 MAG: DNA-directed RNA